MEIFFWYFLFPSRTWYQVFLYSIWTEKYLCFVEETFTCQDRAILLLLSLLGTLWGGRNKPNKSIFTCQDLAILLLLSLWGTLWGGRYKPNKSITLSCYHQVETFRSPHRDIQRTGLLYNEKRKFQSYSSSTNWFRAFEEKIKIYDTQKKIFTMSNLNVRMKPWKLKKQSQHVKLNAKGRNFYAIFHIEYSIFLPDDTNPFVLVQCYKEGYTLIQIVKQNREFMGKWSNVWNWISQKTKSRISKFWNCS